MREHGTRARYVAGCHCVDCRAANAFYAKTSGIRRSLVRAGRLAPPFVDAAPVREHLLALAEAGVGYRRVAALTGLSATTVLELRTGKAPQCRPQTAAMILAVEGVAPADGQLVDAAPTWRLVRRILRQPGWTKRRLSAALGNNGRALQLGRVQVTARNARAVEAVAIELGLWSASKHEERLSLEPLLRETSISSLARQAGVDRSMVQKWHGDGGVPASLADRLAIAVGRHPLEVWPDLSEAV